MFIYVGISIFQVSFIKTETGGQCGEFMQVPSNRTKKTE